MKMSREESTTSRPNATTMASSTNTTGALSPLQTSSCASASCHHEQSLTALTTDVTAMRSLITCKICDRFLYEPYSISCGHTYCYQCLRQWFENNKSKKTCPDCRLKVTQQPTPSYVLRELVLIFASRNELLPDGETSDEHHKWSKEEADLVAADKANTDVKEGGLFKGLFKGVRAFGAIHDASDGVDRCPDCTWELEGPYCGNCGLRVEGTGFSDYSDDSDETDDELDHEIDAEDAAAVFGVDGADDDLGFGLYDDDDSLDGRSSSLLDPDEAIRREFLRDAQRRPLTRQDIENIGRHDGPGISSDEEDSDDEDAAREEMQGFIADDDEGLSGYDDSSATDVPATVQRRRAAPHVVISDDEDEEAPSAGARVTEDDSESDAPIARGSQRNKRAGRLTHRPLPHVVHTSSLEDSEDDDGESVHAFSMHGAGNAAQHGGFSPLDEHEDDDESDEASEVPSSIHPMYASDDDEEHNVDGFDDYHYDRDEDEDEDDGWGPHFSCHDQYTTRLTSTADTEVETGYQPRPATLLQSTDAARHTSSRGPSNLRRPPLPPQAPRSSNTFFNTSCAPPHNSTSHRTLPTTAARSNSSRISHAQSTPRAPAHPFQLSSTLANVNSAYNQRAHRDRRQHDSRRHNQRSSNSSGGTNTVDYGRDGRRKRALSIVSDESDESTHRAYLLNDD